MNKELMSVAGAVNENREMITRTFTNGNSRILTKGAVGPGCEFGFYFVVPNFKHKYDYLPIMKFFVNLGFSKKLVAEVCKTSYSRTTELLRHK